MLLPELAANDEMLEFILIKPPKTELLSALDWKTVGSDALVVDDAKTAVD